MELIIWTSIVVGLGYGVTDLLRRRTPTAVIRYRG
jgi:hypothetical protein